VKHIIIQVNHIWRIDLSVEGSQFDCRAFKESKTSSFLGTLDVAKRDFIAFSPLEPKDSMSSHHDSAFLLFDLVIF